VKRGELNVRTDPAASPTGFPFKVAQLQGSIADPMVYQVRERVCDLGLLREAYQKPDGSVGFRCGAEPEYDFLAKGGDPTQFEGRICLCNSLCASAGVAQVRNGYVEPQLVTIGDDLEAIRDLMPGDRVSFSAAEVIARLLA